MELLWERSPQTAYDLIEALSEGGSRHPNTVRTMLARLVRKGLVEAQPHKNLYLYTPRITRKRMVAAESGTFLERVFGGAIKEAIVHFATRQRLTPEEVREMKRILDEHTERPNS